MSCRDQHLRRAAAGTGWAAAVPRSLAFALLVGAALPASACPLPAPALQQGAVQLAWTWVDAPIVVGRHFAVELRVCPADAVLTRVDAAMPEHRHGMNYRPSLKRINADPPGRWRAEGLMFHMPGRWELRFDLTSPGGSETLLTSVTVP